MIRAKRYFTDSQRSQRKKLLGINLKVARVGAGYTQAEVMERVWGITNNRNRISELENGHVDVNIELLIILADMYGCTVDYLLGRSCEPINDIYANHLNHILLNCRKYFEPMIEQMVGSVTDFMQKVDKDEHMDLVNTCKKIRDYTLKHSDDLKKFDPNFHHLLHYLEWNIRKIATKEAQKQTQFQAHIDNINQRIDREDRHRLLDELKTGYQYSFPLPEPTIEVVE